MRRDRSKVRGGRRRARAVEAFRRRHLALGEQALAEGRGWVKLWIDPWYRLVRREPPGWLRHQMLGALLDIHRSWHDRLAAHEEATGEPFDCMLWLLGPHFVESQVVFAVGDWRDFYRDVFYPAREGAPPTPTARYRAPGLALDELEWRPVLQPDAASEAELAADPAWARVVARHPVLDFVEIGGEPHVIFQAGQGWVGRLPSSPPA